MNFISKEALGSFVDSLRQKGELYGPVRRDGIHIYDSVSSFNDIDLDFRNTKFPPKKFFFPPKENLIDYSKSSSKPAFAKQKKKVIFGIRPCDLNAIKVLDIFFGSDFPDQYYIKNRKNSILIGLNCTEPCKNCFCNSLGTNKIDDGFDLMLYPNEEGYIGIVGTELGEKMIKGYFKESDSHKTGLVGSDNHLSSAQILKLKTSFDDEIWEKNANKCLSCNACVHVCPTCSCFSVVDKTGLSRERFWDSCQSRDFTRVAGNFVFRESRASRLKNRIYHKLDYFKDRFGVHMCVGCGRCITSCITGIDMVKIINDLR